MNIILISLMLVVGIIASISDIKNRKVYNKHLVIAFLLGVLIYIVGYFIKGNQYIDAFIINAGLSLVIGFVFYYFKIWAAGDAKLFSVMVFLIPYEIYQADKGNLFPAFGVLSMIFSIAFLYICSETIYFKIHHTIKEEKKEKFSCSREKIVGFLFNYLIGYNAILVVDHFVSSLLPELYMNNQGLIWLIHIFLMMFLFGRLVNRKKKLIFLGITFFMNCLYSLYFKQWLVGMINIKYLLLVLLIIWIRNVASEYNYETIPTEKVKGGMVLSYGMIMKFAVSRVKGLPKLTDETTKYRITNEQAEAVRRWKNSKYGEDQLVIVRHLPFAPFVFLGTCTFIIIMFCVGR